MRTPVGTWPFAARAVRAIAGAVLVAGCMVGPDYQRPRRRRAEGVHLRDEGRRRHRQHRMVEAIQRSGARCADRRGAPAQPQRQGRGRQCRAGGGRAHADAFGAVPADWLRRASAGARERPNPASRRKSPASSRIRRPSYQALLNASWEIDLWGRIRRLSESARANLLATDEARRGVILSLVASVAGNYLTLRGLDAQLVVAKSTLGAYGESVRLFTLQFQYGQVSQMNVAQVQSQYETAAAQIPQIESQIAQTENALSVLLGRNPGPIARGKSVDELTLPQRSVRLALGVAHAPSRFAPVGRNADRGQCADRRGQGAVLPDDIAHRSSRRLQLRTVEALHRPRARMELCGPGDRADLLVRRGQRPGRAGHGRAAGGALQLPALDPERLCRCRERARRRAKVAGAAGRAGEARRGARRTTRGSPRCNTTAGTRPTRRCCRRSSRSSLPNSRWRR